jgi:hypothetical protein
MLLRVFLGPNLSPDELSTLLDQAEEAARSRLAGFAGIRAEIATDQQNAEQAPYWLATVSAGEHTTKALLDWTAETRATLQR